jgi:hypothetical protein
MNDSWYESRALRWTVLFLAAVGVYWIGSFLYSVVMLMIGY